MLLFSQIEIFLTKKRYFKGIFWWFNYQIHSILSGLWFNQSTLLLNQSVLYHLLHPLSHNRWNFYMNQHIIILIAIFLILQQTLKKFLPNFEVLNVCFWTCVLIDVKITCKKTEFWNYYYNHLLLYWSSTHCTFLQSLCASN